MRSLVAIAALAFTISVDAQIVSVPQPDMKIGDSWVFSRSDALTKQLTAVFQQTVTAVTDQGYRIEGKRLDVVTEPQTLLFDKDSNRVGWIYASAKQLLSFPLEQGKKWPTRYTWKTDDARGEIRYEGTVSVGSWETVTVPAGTFKALKIEGINYWRIGGDGRTGSDTDICWYVPEVKRCAKWTFRVVSSQGNTFTYEVGELREFKPGAGS